VRGRPRLRQTGIAAREFDGECRDGQPCPDASAESARDALVQLVGEPIGQLRERHVLVEGPSMHCVSAGRGQHDRTPAWCVSPKGDDLSCAMVEGGYALRWERFWKDHTC
jgi:endonuclease YncB( thermonuclease family)